ncbi:MAG: type II secretion system protein [Planctomycetota bacterium]|jgi:prepilin-type processing-associated H-X9-DG protein/prepilin-type N-terminal cleavage/methylation domain-containing protein
MEHTKGHREAFTLVELLVVVGIIALLVTILMPSLARALQLTRSAICKTQINGLVKANQLYGADHDEHYVPAASDIFWGASGNLHRWHGARERIGEAFDPAKGPLASYLGHDGRIKQCPSFRDFRDSAGSVAYEAGSGGYGYSDLYVGSEFWKEGFYHNSPGQLRGARSSAVAKPPETVMFTDAAMPRGWGRRPYYVEESFCYCPYNLDRGGSADPGSPRQPSIHFRHLGSANVGWCDGHVGGREDFRSIPINVYGANPEQMGVGWFGPDDNSLFDLE